MQIPVTATATVKQMFSYIFYKFVIFFFFFLVSDSAIQDVKSSWKQLYFIQKNLSYKSKFPVESRSENMHWNQWSGQLLFIQRKRKEVQNKYFDHKLRLPCAYLTQPQIYLEMEKRIIIFWKKEADLNILASRKTNKIQYLPFLRLFVRDWYCSSIGFFLSTYIKSSKFQNKKIPIDGCMHIVLSAIIRR
jgi:hypothetical protein